MSFFLRHFFGFLIQIGAPMILCLVPFDDEELRYPRKKVLAGVGILALLTSLMFPLARQLMVFMPFDQPTILSNLYMLIVLIIVSFLFFYIVRTQTVKRLVVLFLVIFYSATQYLLVNLISPLFPNGDLPDAYPPLILALYAITAAVMFPVVLHLMGKTLKDYLKEMEPQNIKREFSIVFLISMLYFVMLVIYSSRPGSDFGDYWWWVIPPFLFTVAILCIFYWTLFRESVRRKRDSEQQKTMEIQNLQYETITREMENARRIRHDTRHYMAGLYDMLEQGKTQEAKAYLSEVMDGVSKRENQVYCKNLTINGLLQYYVGMARDSDIRCEVHAECEDLPISPVDLTVLFGNAIENAIHACLNCPSDRYIIIQVGVMGNSLVVQITNPCKEVRYSGRHQSDGSFQPAGAFRSLKKGGGYGLTSIEHTAQKYGGDARFLFDETEKTFTTRIRLNLHPEKL